MYKLIDSLKPRNDGKLKMKIQINCWGEQQFSFKLKIYHLQIIIKGIKKRMFILNFP
jgi:hypothetical protein